MFQNGCHLIIVTFIREGLQYYSDTMTNYRNSSGNETYENELNPRKIEEEECKPGCGDKLQEEHIDLLRGPSPEVYAQTHSTMPKDADSRTTLE